VVVVVVGGVGFVVVVERCRVKRHPRKAPAAFFWALS